MLRTLAAMLALLAAPAAAQTAQPSPLEGISAAEARTMPQDELARRVFGQLAGQMRSMTRPYASPHHPGDPPFALTFATAPRFAGDFGQCLATVVHVGQLRADQTLMINDGAVVTEVVYKVIGDLEAEHDFSDAYRAEQERLCAAAGPVVPADENAQRRPAYFTYSGVAPLPTPALISLQHALRDAAAGSFTDVACDRTPVEEVAALCRAPGTLLAGLRLADLTSLRFDRTGRRESEFRLEATFLNTANQHWQLTLDVDFSVNAAEMRRDIRLGHAGLTLIQTFDVADEPPPPPSG